MTDETTSRTILTLASDLSCVDKVEQTAQSFALRAGFDEDTASNIAMVAREAAVNAVVHGNKYDPQKHVTAQFELTGAELIIKVADQGAGFDPDAVPDPLQPENLLRSSGRGIFLMRAFLDEVHLRQLSPGTEITLIKKLPPGA